MKKLVEESSRETETFCVSPASGSLKYITTREKCHITWWFFPYHIKGTLSPKSVTISTHKYLDWSENLLCLKRHSPAWFSSGNVTPSRSIGSLSVLCAFFFFDAVVRWGDSITVNNRKRVNMFIKMAGSIISFSTKGLGGKKQEDCGSLFIDFTQNAFNKHIFQISWNPTKPLCIYTPFCMFAYYCQNCYIYV